MAARRTRAAAMPVIGFLSTASPDKFVPFVDGFRQGLKRTGYVEGENVGIEYRWAEGNYDRLPALAADLVRRQVTVIAAIDGLPSILAAKAATGTIPVVFFTAADPIAFGLVASLNRPSGNVTGVVSLNAEIRPKRLELVHEVIPTATVMALLVNPANRLAEGLVRDSHAAARMLAFPPGADAYRRFNRRESVPLSHVVETSRFTPCWTNEQKRTKAFWRVRSEQGHRPLG
jgi:putative ABC transport system substrate-binding protein